MARIVPTSVAADREELVRRLLAGLPEEQRIVILQTAALYR